MGSVIEKILDIIIRGTDATGRPRVSLDSSTARISQERSNKAHTATVETQTSDNAALIDKDKSLDETQSTTSSSNGDDVESVNKFIDSLEFVEEKPPKKPLPDAIGEKIKSLSAEHKVQYAIWSQSPDDCNRISILGIGAGKIKNQLEETFPNFKFETVESGPLHIKQHRGSVTEKIIRNQEDPGEWEENSRTTCDLILEGGEKDKEHPSDQALHAVVPAHLILNDQQCEELVRSEDPVDIKAIREQVNSQVGWTRYLLQFEQSNKSVDLKHPAIISYRHRYNSTNEKQILGPLTGYWCSAGKCVLQSETAECPHRFMNDIAVLALDSQTPKNFKKAIRQNREAIQSIFYTRIIPITVYSQIVQLLQRSLYIGGLRCHPIPGYNDGIDNAQHRLAFHIRFIMDNPRDRLVAGDSGMIIYAKSENTKHAIAMYTGEFNNPNPHDRPTYQAILLSQALRDIEIAYPHRVELLRPLRLG